MRLEDVLRTRPSMTRSTQSLAMELISDLREFVCTETPPQGHNSDKTILADDNSFSLNPHPRSIPCVTQTPPFLNYFRGQIKGSVAQIEEIQ